MKTDAEREDNVKTHGEHDLMLRNTRGHCELGEKPETDSPLQLSERTDPTNTLISNFWLSVSVV